MAARVAALISIAFLVNAAPPPRRCLLHKRVCVSHCPRQMHPYHTRCDQDTVSQRTCRSPEPYNMGYTCGWSRCDCNGHLVYDEYRGYCVNLSECIHLTRRQMINRSAKEGRKNLKIKDEEDPSFLADE